MQQSVSIKSVSYVIPENSFSNSDKCFADIPEISENWWDFWGINNRRMLESNHPDNELTLAYQASSRALKNANVKAEEVDLILTNMTSPFVSSWSGSNSSDVKKQMFPRLSCFLKEALGANKALNWDVEVECASFIFQLQIAANFIQQGRYKNVLVCSCEYISDILDFTSKSSTTFGDGAAAALLSASDDGADLISSAYMSDAELYELATIRWRYPENLATEQRSAENFGAYFSLSPDGQEKIARFMPEVVPNMVNQALAKSNIQAEDIACYVFHQPSKLLVETWARKLGISKDQYVLTIENLGCLVSASVAVTLQESVAQGYIHSGDYIVLAGAGAGWGYAAQVWKVGDIAIDNFSGKLEVKPAVVKEVCL